MLLGMARCGWLPVVVASRMVRFAKTGYRPRSGKAPLPGRMADRHRARAIAGPCAGRYCGMLHNARLITHGGMTPALVLAVDRGADAALAFAVVDVMS